MGPPVAGGGGRGRFARVAVGWGTFPRCPFSLRLRTQKSREGADGRVPKEVSDSEIHPELRAETCVDPHREERVAPKIKEVVVRTDRFDRQKLLPDLADGSLKIA